MGAGDLGVFIMRGGGVRWINNSSNSPLGLGTCTVLQVSFGDQCNPMRVGEAQGQGLTGQAGTQNQEIERLQESCSERGIAAGSGCNPNRLAARGQVFSVQ